MTQILKLAGCNLAAFLAAVLFSVLANAQQIETARDLLSRMGSAARELNYRGVFTYEHRGNLSTLKVVHGVRNGEAYEVLNHMDGDPREFVRRGNSLDCLRAGDLLISKDQVNVRNGESIRLEDYYQLYLKGEDRIAGRPVHLIHIVPRDGFRYGYIVAVDDATGLMLQSVLMSKEGKPLERFQFVDIKIGAMLEESELQPSTAESLVVDVDRDGCGGATPGLQPQNSTWQVDWLPPGFVLASHKLTPESARESLVYTDGLAAFSVFIDGMQSEALPAVDARLGATVAVLKKLDVNGKSHAICVVGEIPYNTARQVVANVQPMAP